MRILLVPDVPNWAIGTLAKTKMKYAAHHNFKMHCLHPRDAGLKDKQLEFEQVVRSFNPDIIHFEYFRTASQVLEAMPFLRDFKIILSHHNQRDKALFHADWNKLGVDMLVTATNKAAMDLIQRGQENVQVVKYGCELDEFTYNETEPELFTVGYAGRVVPWKGLKEVAEVCQELNVPLKFMGRMEKQEYWESIGEDARQHIDFEYMDCPNDKRVDFYKSLSCYVGFTKDGYEEGTLPYFEASACGVPVITTPNGSAKDLGKNEENCLLIDFEDKEQLKSAILRLRDDAELRAKLKKGSWDMAKNYPLKRFAHEYSKLYYELGSEFHLVSVIIPATYDRTEQVKEILKSLDDNSYENIEAVVCWDEVEIKNTELGNYRIPIKQIYTEKKGYNLAMARNMGVIEAEGKDIVFCDSRLKPDLDSVLMFQQAISHAGDITMGGNKKIWFFGDKGGAKRSFIENFSAVTRRYFIEFGMFNERIDRYGGMSQEVRTRWQKQGGQTTYLGEAKAVEIRKTSRDADRLQDIIESKYKLLKMYGDDRY